MHTFDLEGREFIELNKILKIFNLVESGGQANQLIAEGLALVNGEVDTRKRKKLRSGDVVEFYGEEIKIV